MGVSFAYVHRYSEFGVQGLLVDMALAFGSYINEGQASANEFRDGQMKCKAGQQNGGMRIPHDRRRDNGNLARIRIQTLNPKP